jgi:hypothetical protein
MKARYLLIGVAVVAVLGLPIVLMLFIWSLVTGMAPVPEILHQLDNDSAVIAVTGSPVSLRMWGGSLHINDGNNGGYAVMDTTAYGPRGTMHFIAKAQRPGGAAWTITYLAIFPAGGQVVRIDADHPAAPEVETPATTGVPTHAAVPLVMAGAVLMAACVVVGIMVLLGSFGSLSALRRRYPENPREIPTLRLGSMRLGLVSYNNCIRLGLSPHGLFIRWGFPIAFRAQVVRIPLADLHDPVVTRSWLGSWVKCTVGDERRAMTVPLWLFEGTEIGRNIIMGKER